MLSGSLKARKSLPPRTLSHASQIPQRRPLKLTCWAAVTEAKATRARNTMRMMVLLARCMVCCVSGTGLDRLLVTSCAWGKDSRVSLAPLCSGKN